MSKNFPLLPMIITVFGCSGFLGRYVVSVLAKLGNIVITPYRGDEDEVRHLRVCGNQLGTIIQPYFQPTSAPLIRDCIKDADAVINIIGRDYDSRSFNMHQINAQIAELIAKECAAAGIKRLLHVSALTGSTNKDLKGWSLWRRENRFLSSKMLGEELVLQHFPSAAIVRPAIMYGYEDRLLNVVGCILVFAQYSRIIPMLRPASAVKYPVHVGDVAQAISQIVIRGSEERQTEDVNIWELYGPQQMTVQQIYDFSIKYAMRQAMQTVRLSPTLYRLYAFILREWRQNPTCRISQVKNLLYDEVLTGKNGFQDLGIEPSRMEMHGIEMMRVYRPQSDYYDSILNKEL